MLCYVGLVEKEFGSKDMLHKHLKNHKQHLKQKKIVIYIFSMRQHC